MSYVVLARKHRPQNFSQLKGQGVLVQTITNAFLNEKLHHAYLLTGIRGIGKTTTARIVAKTLNCSNLKTENSILMPCEECDNCCSFQNGSHPDILEFDAASHTGIDDIKTMLEGVSYAPSIGKCRVFIVDEVHMLSTKAFNSLLKTLEEPPQNVVFIFATTELQKVPVTILSRCQKFSLVPLSVGEMSLHLEEVAKKENIKFSKDAIEIIAKKSGGSVRDALSLLDQASMKAGGVEISKEEISQMLSIVSVQEIEELYTAVTNGKVQEVIFCLQNITKQGVTELSILEEFLELLYGKIHFYINNGKSYGQILRLWNVFLKSTEELSYAFNKFAILEVIFLKGMHVFSLPSAENLVNGISEGKILDILKDFPESDVVKK